MRLSTLLILSILVSGFLQLASATTPSPTRIDLLATGSESEARNAVSTLAGASVDSLANWISNFTNYPKPDTIGKFVHIAHKINDSLTAPALLYIPSSYDGKKPLPLVLYLHGGVSTKDFYPVSDSELTTDNLVKICEQRGWFYLFPLAKIECLWWNVTGVNHLNWLIREVKRRYFVDDDRVNVCGFSDGGSGSYHLSMVNPTDLAQLFPWSGHMAVGSLDGEMQQNLPNMRARPLYATVGGVDQLYPTKRMLPMLQVAQQAGASLNVTVYDTATHNDAYLALEYPEFIKRVERNYRNPYSSSLYWETSDLRFNTVDWLSITTLDTLLAPAPWYKEYTCKLVSDNVTIGFNADRTWEGDGVKVDAVVPDSSSVAFKMGLKSGDILIALDNFPIHNMMDLTKSRSTKKRGDPVAISFLRGTEKMTKKSAFPPIEEYNAFPRKAKSGAVVAHRIGNRFELETSRVKNVTLFLNPALVRFEQPVTVVINGKTVYDGMVNKNAKLLLEKYAENRDKSLLWWAKLDLTVPK